MTILDIAQAMRGKLRDGYSAPQAGGAALTSELSYGTAQADSLNGFVDILMDNMPAGGNPADYTFSVACDSPISNGDRVAYITIDGVGKAVSTATVAQIAQDAADVANATNQYFWNDTNGIHVSTDEGDPDGARNILINSLGILLRKLGNTLVSITETAVAFFDGNGDQTASFGTSGAVIGIAEDGKSRVEVSPSGMSVVDRYQGNDVTIAEIVVDSHRPDGVPLAHYTFGERGARAVGEYSFVSGATCDASGNYSFATGHGAASQGDNQTSIGRYNVLDSTSAFIVGNGYSEATRSNAFTVDFNGDTVASGDITDGSGNVLATVADGGTVLYTSSTGTGANSSFPLSSSAANFGLLDFIYTDGTRRYTARLYDPNGQSTSINRTVISGSTVYHASMMLSVSGTTVTTGAGAQSTMSGSSISTSTSSPPLKIIEVRGR